MILKNNSNFRLTFELVPDGCWYSNLRHFLSAKDWDKIRFDAYKKANGKCMICGRKTTRLEAHERWSYNIQKGVQILEDVIAVCHSCHSVIHIGRTQLVGDIERAEKHFQKVNNCTYADFRKALGQANEDHQRRNKISQWNLDLNWLQRFIKE